MFRKSDSARREWKLELVRSCAIRQSSILEQAARMVRPGGHLAYTTCTFSVEENEAVIAKFVDQHPEFELEIIQPAVGFQPARPDWVGLRSDHILTRTVRIWPHLTQGEGHFIALLVKQGSNDKHKPAKAKKTSYLSNRTLKSMAKNPIGKVLDDFCYTNFTLSLEKSRIIVDGTYVYQVPEDVPDLTGIKVIHPGWWLGSIGKDRFIPSHSLAMGMKRLGVKQHLSLQVGDQRLTAYFAGESFPDQGENGWVLVMVEGFPVGWGKRVQNVLKNFYPHGLRRSSKSLV